MGPKLFKVFELVSSGIIVPLIRRSGGGGGALGGGCGEGLFVLWAAEFKRLVR